RTILLRDNHVVHAGKVELPHERDGGKTKSNEENVRLLHRLPSDLEAGTSRSICTPIGGAVKDEPHAFRSIADHRFRSMPINGQSRGAPGALRGGAGGVSTRARVADADVCGGHATISGTVTDDNAAEPL